MGVIIDTCIFIKVERSKDPVDFKKWEIHGKFYISAVTVSELLVGVHLADGESRKIKRMAFVESIIDKIPALDFTSPIARIHAELLAKLHKSGAVIGAHDLIIAATALAYDYAILTANHNEFARIPNLKLLS